MKSKQEPEAEEQPVKSRLSMVSTANRRQSVAVKENTSPNVSPKRKVRHSLMPTTSTSSKSKIPVKRGSSLLPEEIKKGVSLMYN